MKRGMTREEAIKMLEHLATDTTGTLAGWQGDYAQFLVRVIDSLDMAIAALMEQPQWISVEERLPEDKKDEYVLVVCDYHGKISVETRKKWNLDSSVTHWMPLPEPPEVEV